jgi:hypothetical protein
MTDLKLLAIFVVVFWAYVAWWIAATNPLASSWNRRLFDTVTGILTCLGLIALFLGLTGLSAEYWPDSKNKK